MNRLLVAVTAPLLLGLQLFATYYTRSAWILLGSLALMGYFIFTRNKELALAIVLAMFGYGASLATMEHRDYISDDIKIVRGIVIDEKSGRRFKIAAQEFHAQSEHAGKDLLVCQSYLLFGRETKDRFCYLRRGSDLFRLEEVRA